MRALLPVALAALAVLAVSDRGVAAQAPQRDATAPAELAVEDAAHVARDGTATVVTESARRAKPRLRDVRGNRRDLGEFKGYKALVLAFLGVDCPLANLYVPRLIELDARYAPQQVKFLAVYSNENENLPEIASHSDDRDVPFLVVKDFSQRLADELGVTRTPTVVVLDGARKQIYRGRIDDQYSVASRKPQPSSHDLVRALDEVIAGKAVSVGETEADGCLLDRDPVDPGFAGVTFTKDIASIFQRRCEVCHRPGQIGPFSLVTHRDVARRKNMIKEVIVDRRMPPWHADPRYGEFANDRSMTEEEINKVVAWVDAGAPRGDSEDMPPPVKWKTGWTLGKPDRVMSIPKTMKVPAEGVVKYQYLTTKTDFDEDVWVQRVEIRPGNPEVVHHVLVYIRPPGTEARRFSRTTMALVNWVPGSRHKVNPPGTATRIPKGSSLLWELHYTPNGKATTDRTQMAMVFAKQPPERETRFNIFAKTRFRIGADAPHHEEEHTMRFSHDSHILSFRPHMHLRGKSWRYEATYPDGKQETLLSVPNWDFNWQTEYFFQKPVFVPEGTVLRATARWDNSDNNPANPDRTKVVRYGLQTFEEMMNGWVKYVPDNMEVEAKALEARAKARRNRRGRRGLTARFVFDYLDKDKNGEMTAKEWSASTQTKPDFERRGIKIDFPIKFEKFESLYDKRR